MFDAEQAMEHITNLAHNHLEGRLTGSYGGELAGNYIADRFAEYGLEPVIRGGSYFQEFTSTVTHNTVQPVLRIIGDVPFSSYNYDAHDEFIPRTIRYLGSGEVTAEVVWLGACEPSDFSSYRVKGKIVLCAPLSGPEEQDAFAAAEQADVGGLLIITEDDGPYPRSAYGTGELKYFPAYRVPRAFIYDLLSDTPYRWWDFFWGRTFTPRPGSYPALIETTVRMVNQFERTDEHARNVLGLLPGCDSAYDDEFVIVGAHYDHIGVDPDGTIYNGANDNASGVAVMLEIARLWADQGYCPDRSVLFAAWDAEEQWLVGSTHYVNEHPVFPLDQTIAYLNLDMVGVGPQVHIHGLETDAVRAQLQSSAETFGVSQLIITPDNEGDDKPFAQAGIPSAWLAMQMDGEKYYYPQYHRPDDDPGIIELDSLQTSGRIATHALLSLSAAPPGCPAETFTVNLVNGYAVITPAGTPVQVTKGWEATSMAYLSDFLEAISME
ncbi:MAG: M28 family peptidase, partial [Anaerolineales bacterium]